MAKDYVFNRVKEALRLHRGNTIKARQQLTAWTYEDPKLLHELARPHLTGIVAYVVDRYLRHEEQSKVSRPLPKSVLDRPADERFGRELLKTMVDGEPDVFGEEPSGRPVSKSKASLRHQDTMRMLAGKGRKPVK